MSEQETSGPKLGGLKINKKARGRRDKVKFFDSADWAMKGQNQDQCAQPPTENVLSAYTQLPEGVPNDGESPLADENESSLAGGGPQSLIAESNESPLAG